MEVDPDNPETLSEEAVSALAENIARKGKNAYYYAHSHGASGPIWDGKEEPRLLKVDVTSSVKTTKVSGR